MSRKQKGPASQQNNSAASSPEEQPILGRLHGSGTDLEETLDSRHDISSVDQQEGNMNHGTKGGCFDEEDDIVKGAENL